MNKILFSSLSDNWSTPQDLFDRLNAQWHFTIDVCADEFNYKCKRYYSKDQDGLSQNWSGERVWCNPPYGREISKWVAKCALADFAVMLVPARTDTNWFHSYIYHNSRCTYEFLKGRLKFGGSKNSAPFPSMIVVFGGC